MASTQITADPRAIFAAAVVLLGYVARRVVIQMTMEKSASVRSWLDVGLFIGVNYFKLCVGSRFIRCGR